jgi:nucleotide-binding universal stress UspA family protein
MEEEGRSDNSSYESGVEKKRKVMVAIDESDCSHYALEWALQNLGDSLVKSEFFIFTVQPIADYTYLYASSFGAAPPDLVRSFQENQKKFSLALLEKAKGICSKYGIVAETLTEIGNPKEAICEAVEKLDIQLLVLGSQGRGVIKRALLGSVSNYCAHNAKCPVLVVKKTV